MSPFDPSNVIAEVESSTAADVVERAIELGRQPLPGPTERAERLRSLGARLTAEAQPLAEIVTAEVGKLPVEAAAEVGFAAAICAHYAGRLSEGASDAPSGTRRRSVPLAGVVTPFNFPASIPIMKLAAAYGAGAPALWKPSPHALGVSLALQPLLTEELGPVVAPVLSGRREALEAVATEADAISFTGGEAGARLLWSAVQRPKAMQMELGSCNATIIGRDADVALVVSILTGAMWSFAGQKCSNTRRVLVPVERLDDVAEGLVESARRQVTGDPTEPETTIPPVISLDAARGVQDRVRSWSAEAGSRSYHGEQALALENALPATIVVAARDALALREEIFGPAAVVIPYASFSEALSLAGATRYGLFAGLLSHDEDEISSFLAADLAGILKINQPTPGLVPELASQGWDASGCGPSELGPDPFRPFQRLQTVYPFEVGDSHDE